MKRERRLSHIGTVAFLFALAHRNGLRHEESGTRQVHGQQGKHGRIQMDRNYADPRRVVRSSLEQAVASQRSAEQDRAPRDADGEKMLGDDIRCVPPMTQLAEQISNLRARVLCAVDDLAAHTNKLVGEEYRGEDTRDLGKEVSAANTIKGPPAVDRLFIELGSLEASVCYLEQQVQRATVLA
jgi:hypothetical protein